MSSRRRRWNARLAALKGTEQESWRPRETREDWVLHVAAKAVGTGSRDGMLHREDIVSDVILKLLDAGGFAWEESEIVEFCKGHARKIMNRHIFRAERTEAELLAEDKEDEKSIFERLTVQAAMQEISFIANQSKGLLRAIPTKHREALETLCDGGNPVEVAEEQGITVAEAIRLIKEARLYVQRVDPA